jgi:hypothetical protein
MAGQSPAEQCKRVFRKWASDNGAEIVEFTESEHFPRIDQEVELDVLTARWDNKFVKIRFSSRCPQDITVKDEDGIIGGEQTFQKSKMYFPSGGSLEEGQEIDWDYLEDQDWSGMDLSVDHKHYGERVDISPPKNKVHICRWVRYAD